MKIQIFKVIKSDDQKITLKYSSRETTHTFIQQKNRHQISMSNNNYHAQKDSNKEIQILVSFILIAACYFIYDSFLFETQDLSPSEYTDTIFTGLNVTRSRIRNLSWSN